MERRDNLVEVDGFPLKNLFPLGCGDIFGCSRCITDVEFTLFDVFVIDSKEFDRFGAEGVRSR